MFEVGKLYTNSFVGIGNALCALHDVRDDSFLFIDTTRGSSTFGRIFWTNRYGDVLGFAELGGLRSSIERNIVKSQ